MAVSFDLSNADWTIHRRSQVRLLVGDTVEGSGPRPTGGNFQDEELDALMALENGSLQRAVALVFETLAAEWSRTAGEYRLGPESEASRQAEAFAARAREVRERHGHAYDGEGESAAINWERGYEDWHNVHRGESWLERPLRR